MDISLVDITLHIRNALSAEQRHEMQDAVHQMDGVVSTHLAAAHPQTMLVEINPQRTDGDQVLQQLLSRGVDADLVVPDRL